MLVKVDKVIRNDIENSELLKAENREGCITQCDTDSAYGCFDELYKKFSYMNDMDWFYCLEKQMIDFWNKILEIKARKNKMPQLIKFERENMFSYFFSFGKKMYLGSIVDAEGERLGYENYHQKIRGVVLRKAEFPDFCKENATPLAFDIVTGISQEEAEDRIRKCFTEFCKQPIDRISSKRGISDYKKYVTRTMDDYLKNGLQFTKGQPANVKMALAYNYICNKYEFSLEPITSGGKFNYVFLKPNKYNIESIGFIGAWPQEFNKIFEIDYETCFRKFFLAIFKEMFKVLKWIGSKDEISLKKLKINKFIR